MYVEVWRTSMKCSVMEEADAMRVKLEAELKAGTQYGAMRQVQLVMAGAMRGMQGAALQAMRLSLAEEKRRADELDHLDRAVEGMPMGLPSAVWPNRVVATLHFTFVVHTTPASEKCKKYNVRWRSCRRPHPR